ncbi:MAG: hypothetical protein NZ695_03250 [Dehalococcoidia bacterium]|nr:hypothetical protein [Dehalococcoidia bacterium]MDW8009595.1 hypothetical protein [Chloroflexota bacterium]
MPMHRRSKKAEEEEEPRPRRTRRPREEEEQVEERGPGLWDLPHRWIRSLNMLVGLAILTVEGLLALRLAFQLTGADAGNEFVNFIYDLTGWLVGPFQGIGEEREALGGILEPATPIAMGIYLAAALLTMAALGAIAMGLPPAAQTRTIRRRRAV